MNNNDILRRIRYVFDFGDSKMIAIFGKAEDVLGILELAEFRISKHELSAFFRKSGR